jgi:hypothetical protein
MGSPERMLLETLEAGEGKKPARKRRTVLL